MGEDNNIIIRDRLLALQTELQGRLERTQSEERAEVEGREDSNAQLWEASEIRDGLNDEAASELRDIGLALARLDAGDYGTCTSCGNAIDEKRLAALPYVSLCMACAE